MFPNTPANDAERPGEVARLAALPILHGPLHGRLHGRLRIHVFTDEATGLEHVALVAGDVFRQERLATRDWGLVLARIPHFIGPGRLDRPYLEPKAQRSGNPLYPNGTPET